VYSDGSTHVKHVEWDIEGLDFTVPGKREISGRIMQDQYPFPLAVGYADPVVFPWQGRYYYIATNDNKQQIGFYAREADSVDGLFTPGVRESILLDYNEEKGFIQTFWAPEFHVIGGELYLLFAVGGKAWGPQSHMMKLRTGGSVINPSDWEEPIRVVKRDGEFLTVQGITLDMTYFHANGKDYLVWSYRMMKPNDSGSMLCIAAIDPQTPWQLTSEPVLLSRPLYGWENNDGTINNEGPFPLLVGDTIYLAYSGGAAGGYTYAVGFLSAHVKADLLNPSSWHKQTAPAMSNSTFAEEFGPGHNSFFVDRNGDVMNVYHAQQGMERSARCTAIRRVHFGKDGAPRLDLTTEQDLPEAIASVRTTVVIV
jgi:GH43 family beta-xylosidase